VEYNDRIRQYIKSNGLIFGHVADKAGIKYQRFSRIMNNKTEISVDEYERICSALGVKLDFFQKKFLESKNISA
jgi:transcriptional regulator with XRE-family HTH domain